MKLKSLKSLLTNKKFLGAVSISAVSLALLLAQRKSVTVVEVDGDLVLDANNAE